jgi:hypothetical protein
MHEPRANCDMSSTLRSNIVPFTNLNILQYAVVTGDVTLMEENRCTQGCPRLPVSDEHTAEIPAFYRLQY